MARRWPTTRDLGLTKRITGREIGLLVVVFVVSHAIFWLLAQTADPDPGQARRYFQEMGLGGPVITAAASLIASAVLAAVCEELLYRGAIVRPIHDHLARRGRAGLGAVIGILVAALAFAMPHLGGSLTGVATASYLVTGIAFGLVYVITGSLTAAMVSHSLQSCYAFTQVLLLGRGDDHVSPLLYVIVFGCPLWTYLCARGLAAVLPTGPTATTHLVGRRRAPCSHEEPDGEHDRPSSVGSGSDGVSARSGGSGQRPGRTTIASPTGRSPVASDGLVRTVLPVTSVVEPPPSRLMASRIPRARATSAVSGIDRPRWPSCRPSEATRIVRPRASVPANVRGLRCSTQP